MFSGIKINKTTKIILVSALLIFIIVFVYIQNSEKICLQIVINIEDKYDIHFITSSDILSLMTNNGQEFIIGKKYKNINLKNIELIIKSHKFVQNVEVYKDHTGKLIINIKQNKPIARVILNDGSGFYIGSAGQILPLSENFTARVVLIETKKSFKLFKNEFIKKKDGKAFLNLLNFIDNNKFWKAQIAHIVVKRNIDILLYPQVGKQVIEFGKPYNIEKKFRKLEIFFKKILPAKGWNKYKTVNLKFQDQIVCK